MAEQESTHPLLYSGFQDAEPHNTLVTHELGDSDEGKVIGNWWNIC